MSTAYVIVTVLLALMAALSGVLKLIRHPKVLENLGTLAFPESWLPRLAAAELLGATGVLLGLAVPALGVAAAVGLVAYFVGAVTFHVRADDLAGVSAPAPFLLFAIVGLVLRLATL